MRNMLRVLIPDTVAFVHGPQGSGKSRMLNDLLKDTDRSVTPANATMKQTC